MPSAPMTLAAGKDRHANVAFFLLEILPLHGAIQQHRFAAYLGNNDGFPAFHDAAGNSFADAVLCPLSFGRNSVGCFDMKFGIRASEE